MWHGNSRYPVARTMRGVLSALWLTILFPLLAAAQSNPIVLENQNPGSSAWNIEWGSAGDDVTGQIKGLAKSLGDEFATALRKTIEAS